MHRLSHVRGSCHHKLNALLAQIKSFSATRFSTSVRIKKDQCWRLQDLQVPELQVVVLRDAEILEFPPSLLVKQLVVVDISASGIVKLPSEIACLDCVKLLRLDRCNKLSSLPSELGTMGQLRVLSMRECRSIYEIPESLVRLPSLTKLLMPFCGVARFLHSELQGLQHLRIVGLE